MDRTLLLNASFEPLKVISWQRAITLLTQGKVEVIESYEREIRGVTITFRLPSVLRLLKLVKIRRASPEVRFSRANIYQRDQYTCQYCGARYAAEELTFDHVIPLVQGGDTSWENIVTACLACNNRKGGRTPRQADLRLVRAPMKPKWMPVVTVTIGIKSAPLSWRDYLYWNIELDKDG
ncbi:MAG: HNH endonuclease [Nitrospirae bacterium GWC2_57_13]|jgi:5-methylcytosine-specific restriction endonuclease McrA|nr:MAG: HNH endonuclease [Nitrospirae bacterium GWC2_57_13]OGW44912.1 MAG: HNH endonuclease [Nitrospirae bacterium GWD2_57_8]HAR46035.1 HNH endonuclease [Nitrospiraceae bacterium]